MPTCTIHFATQADLVPMSRLLSELFTLEADFQADPVKQLQGLQLILDNPSLGQLFVLRYQNQVVGMANALFTISTAQGGKVVLLEDVIVHAEYRGQGLGKRLLQAVCQWAQQQGYRRITLLVDRDNTAAQAFYQRLGFEASAMLVLRKT